MMNRRIPSLAAVLFAFTILAATTDSKAQMRQPIVSPYASVSEEVGLTDITIRYARPAVNGRKIWGELVPYGFAPPFPNFGNGKQVPWRAGANRNTTISFEHNVLIEGRKLNAGTYGLQMIPSEGNWTIVFSNDSENWGGFWYEEAHDALRVAVTPEKAPFKERLAYEFMDQNNQGGVTIALLWEEMKIPFRVEVDDYQNVVFASMRNELLTRGGFTSQNYATLANYAVANNVALDEAARWADQAIAANTSFNTLSVKARVLMRQGAVAEGDAMMVEPIDGSTENELNFYGYQLMALGRMDKAGEIFRLNVERHPDSWNPYDSLGEYYKNVGDNANAQKFYETALDRLPEGDEANRDRIRQILGSMGV